MWVKFLIIFGELKLVKWFPWIQYDPVEYKITGNEILQIAEFIKPGDIVFRRYDGYVDNWFIDGRYTHVGIYVGNNELIHAVHPCVEKIGLIDFCRCDNVSVLRPVKGATTAIAKAGEYLLNKTPYDFSFVPSDDELYCFELVANCYAGLDIKPKKTSALCGLIQRTAYLGSSFFESPDFVHLYEA